MNQNSNNDFHAKNAKSFNNRLSNPTGLNVNYRRIINIYINI